MRPHPFRLLASTALVALAGTFAFAGPTSQPSVAAYPLKVDPVSGEALPATGVVTEEIDGREVHFANQANVEKFKAGGEANHKKMDELVIAAEKPNYKYDKCPVSDEKLGEMGKPIEYVDRSTNRLIELCCKSCLKSAKKDPAAALKKIDEAAAKR